MAGCALLAACCVIACGRNPEAQAATHTRKALAAVSAGKLADAIIEYRLAIEAKPQSGDAHLALADTYFKVGDFRHAVESYVRAADLLSTRLDVQVKTGTLLLAGGRFDDAKVRAERALAIAPNDIDAHVLLANALAGLRNPEGAVKQIQEAIALDPSRSTTYTSLASIEIGRGRQEAAEEAFRKAIELDETSAMAHLSIGNFYWASGKLADAERELTRALALQPDNVVTRQILAGFFATTNRPAQAEEHLKKVFELNPTAEAGLTLADFYLGRNDRAAARTLLTQLASRDDTKTRATLRLASLDHAAGQKDRAYEQVNTVLAADSRNLDALLAKSSLLLTDGKEKRLWPPPRRPWNITTSPPRAYAVGKARTALRQVDAAIRAYENTVRLNPRAVVAKVALAELHLASGRSQASLGFAQEALKAEPENPDARLALAKGYIARGDAARASTELDRLAAKYPNSAAILVQIGIVKARQNNAAAARRSFEQALKLDPEDADAMSGLIALDLSAKHVRAAKRIEEYMSRPRHRRTC